MAEIGAKTQLCGIVLHPAGHTRSPAMHNAAFRSLGLDAVYLAFDVPPADLAGAVAGARGLGIRQLAVSIPHKLAVMEHLDEVDPVARRIGAVNTVTRRGDRLVGSNTDWAGVVEAIERQGERSLEGTRSVVLGAGGAARAVVYGLASRGSRVTILNRTEARAHELAAELEAEGAGALADLAEIEHDVLVNTTSVGLGGDASPVAAEALRPGSLVMDAVYEPERTRLLRDAAERGARTLGGKWMLVHQAARQLETWTGREAPVEVMAEAFDRAGRGSRGG
ncbi:MAG: shikimate dehydrogenase [Myxococcota bacterium]